MTNPASLFQRKHVGNCHENSRYKKVSTQQISTLNCFCACSNCFHFAKGDGGIINAIHITFTYDQWWQSFETSSKSNLKWHMAHISIGAIQLCSIWKLDLTVAVFRQQKIKQTWQKNTAQPPKPLEFFGRHEISPLKSAAFSQWYLFLLIRPSSASRVPCQKCFCFGGLDMMNSPW